MLRKIRLQLKLNSRKFEDALTLIPPGDNIGVTYLIIRSHCYFKLQQYDNAKQSLNKIKQTEEDPYNLYLAYNNQGYHYLEQQVWDQAIAELNKARQLQPQKSFALNNLGYAYLFTNRLEDGGKLIDEASKMDIRNYYAIRNKGIYYMHKQQYPDALRVLEKAKENDKNIDDIDVLIAICAAKIFRKNNPAELLKNPSAFQLARIEKLHGLFP